MKQSFKVFTRAALFLMVFIIPISIHAVWVNGYYRSDGTYVRGHERTAPDGNPYNNYSYPGNYNPNTGSVTGGNPSTYLENYYNNSSGYSGSYTGFSNPYLSIPSCPGMSLYDSISGGCKCMSGYVADSTGTCVSGNTLCHKKHGYNSSYTSYDKSCTCDYGYIMDSSDQCVSQNTQCRNLYGYGSEYSVSQKKCVCSSGYQVDSTTNTCVYRTSYSAYSASTVSCPENSRESLTDPTKCTCNSGYVVNSAKTSCVPEYQTLDQACKTNFGISSSWSIEKSTCITASSGGTVLGSAVNSTNQSDTCKISYGEGAYKNGTFCYCQKTYQWNSAVSGCIKSKNILTKNLKIGAEGGEVVILKNFLANQNLYMGKVNTAYDGATYIAVSDFQKDNGITQTGTVGPTTRARINSLILTGN